jgi:hypothetical protein
MPTAGEAAAPPPAEPPARSSVASTPSGAAARSQKLDAHALANRGLDRELQGDRAGALADLKSALSMETDRAHREGIENLIRLLEAPQ